MTEMDLDSKLKEALALADRHRQECVRLTDDMTRLSRRLIDTETELAQARRDLEDVRRELAEQESVDRKLNEFNLMLEKVEDMKRKYEKKISTLQARLNDAKSKLSKEDNYDLFETIDMKAEAARNDASERRRMRYKGECRQDKRVSGRSEEFPKPSSADDWLLSLPDNL